MSVSTSRQPSPSASSSKLRDDGPQVKVRRRGGSNSVTVRQREPHLGELREADLRALSKLALDRVGNQAASSPASVTARQTRSIGWEAALEADADAVLGLDQLAVASVEVI